MIPSDFSINPFQEDNPLSTASKSPQFKPKQTLEEHRSLIRKLKPNLKIMQATKLEDPIKIPVSNNFFMKVECFRPNIVAPLQGWPTVFYIPGTAFISEEFAFTDAICKHLANVSGAQILVLRPRTSPEVIFPTPLEELKAAFLYIVNQKTNDFTSPYFINPLLMGLAGYSSGANLALSLAIELKSVQAAPWHLLDLMLVSPLLDMPRAYNIANRVAGLGEIDNLDFTNTQVMKPEAMKLMFEQLMHPIYSRYKEMAKSGSNGIGEPSRRADIQADINEQLKQAVATYLKEEPSLSPLNREPESLRNLPPITLIHGGRGDVCTYDCKQLVKAMRSVGVNLEPKRWNYYNHAMIWQHDDIIEDMAIRIRKYIQRARVLTNEPATIIDTAGYLGGLRSDHTPSPASSNTSSQGHYSPSMSSSEPEDTVANSPIRQNALQFPSYNPQSLPLSGRRISERSRHSMKLSSSISHDSLNTPLMASMQLRSPPVMTSTCSTSTASSSPSSSSSSPRKCANGFSLGLAMLHKRDAPETYSLSAQSASAAQDSRSPSQSLTSRSIMTNARATESPSNAAAKPPLFLMHTSTAPQSVKRGRNAKNQVAHERASVSHGRGFSESKPGSVIMGSTMISGKTKPKP